MSRFSFDIRQFDEVESTNTLVKAAIEAGEREGVVCVAATQTGGYGRQGRTWESPRGGLYMSVLLRPQEAGVSLQQLPTLGLVVALSVCDAIAEVAPVRKPLVKWPNDVYCAEGKLAGISFEAHAGAVCIGIGVNVAGSLPFGYVLGADSDETSEGDIIPAFLSHSILEGFAQRYEAWKSRGFSAFQQEFNDWSYLTGREVHIVDLYGNVLADGVAGEVDELGRLAVTGSDGIAHVTSGEAHIVPADQR